MSAKLSNIQIVTIEIGGLYSHVKRPRWVMEFLEKQNASDEDIVITVDGSDVIVSDGEKYDNAVKYIIQKSTESKDKFNEEDIVGDKMAKDVLVF